MIAARAIATCVRYGRRYPSSRRMSTASYALPSTSSSWWDKVSCWVSCRLGSSVYGREPAVSFGILLEAKTRLKTGDRRRSGFSQLFFQLLLPEQLCVDAATAQEIVVMALLGNPSLLQHDDHVRVAHRGHAVRHDQR